MGDLTHKSRLEAQSSILALKPQFSPNTCYQQFLFIHQLKIKNMAKSKYCYAIVKKDNGQMLLDSEKLPIYWNKKVAQNVCKNFTGYCVHPVILEKLEYFLLTTSK